MMSLRACNLKLERLTIAYNLTEGKFLEKKWEEEKG